ncbi:MAG: polysaccharide deacetylase family protein [Candidatus Gottesmanbacteria bacterium]|nr:polysaccharide deacetylase family protein [Candidatus Gottesmanbacteria bacterium]
MREYFRKIGIHKPNFLLCMDFETAISSRKIHQENFSINKLRDLDNGDTLKALETILNILKKYNQTITFFIVFKLEKIYPGIINKILSHGHEVGWHGYSHSFLNDKFILKKELDESYSLIKKYNIQGFQAPNITFFKAGYPLLKRYGLRYSSSIYGNSSALYNFDGILEIPVSVSNSSHDPDPKEISFPVNLSPVNLLKLGIPFGSSYFWSLLGHKYYSKKLDIAKKENRTVNLFIHNWQLYSSNRLNKIRTDERIGLFANPLFYPYKINVMNMFENLLSKYKFTRCIDYIKMIKSYEK